MIATPNDAPFRKVRLNRRNGENLYRLKERFAALCEEHSVGLVSIVGHAAEAWTEKKDRRRCFLIDKSLHAELAVVEQQELSRLQREAEAHFDEVAPPPIDGALKIHAQLLELANTKNE